MLYYIIVDRGINQIIDIMLPPAGAVGSAFGRMNMGGKEQGE